MPKPISIGTRLKINYPRKVSEFRVQFRGQHVCQDPVIEIVMSRNMHEMFATYDPYVGGGYDPHVWFIRMPRGIKMNAIRAIMRDIAPAVIRMIDAQLQTNLYDPGGVGSTARHITAADTVMICAAENLTDTVNIAIRDYVQVNENV